MSTEWDERFAPAGHVYGEVANDFLIEVCARMPRGKVLSLGEGEGRNAVFLAERGFAVTAVDGSAVGLAKASALAARRGTSITPVHADLASYPLPRESWSGIVSIFCHLPRALRAAVHAQVFDALAPGGVFILEAYRPEQLERKTGGPKNIEMLPTLADLEQELSGLVPVIGREIVREIHEGNLHDGPSAVVQLLAIKPV